MGEHIKFFKVLPKMILVILLTLLYGVNVYALDNEHSILDLPRNYSTYVNPIPPKGYRTITIRTDNGQFTDGNDPIRFIYVKQGEKLEPFSAHPYKDNYEFVSWNKDGRPYDFSLPVTRDFDLCAHYEYVVQEDPYLDYTVNYNLINLDGCTYETVETVEKSTKKGNVATPVVNSYAGFESPEREVVLIDRDNIEIDYYYPRKRYHVEASPGRYIKAINGVGEYLYGETVNLCAIPQDDGQDHEWVYDGDYRFKDNKTHVFDEWSDGTQTLNKTFTMPAHDVKLRASGLEETTSQEEYRVNLENGDYVVSTLGSGWYPKGSEIEVTATVSENYTEAKVTQEPGYRYHRRFEYEFDAWSDGDTSAVRTLTVDHPIHLEATGKSEERNVQEEYKISIDKGENIISVEGDGWYPKGSVVDLTANVMQDYTEGQYTTEGEYRYRVVHNYHECQWSDGSSNETKRITVLEPMELSVSADTHETKVQEQYKVTIDAGENIAEVTDVSLWQDKGKEIPIEATLYNDYTEDEFTYEDSNNVSDGERYHNSHDFEFESWSDGNTEANRTICVTEPIHLTATGTHNTFKSDQQFKLNVQAGENVEAIVGERGWRDANTTVDIKADLDNDYTEANYTLNAEDEESSDYRFKKVHHFYFDKWSDGLTDKNRTLTMNQAYDLTATATEDDTEKADEEYRLTLSASSNVVAVADVSGWKPKGSKVDISATLKANATDYTTEDGYRYKKTYAFEKWSDGSTTNKQEITMNEPVVLEATGTEGKTSEEYLLTLKAGNNITSVANVSGWKPKGSQVEISATPQTNATKYTTETGYRYKKTYAFSKWSDKNTTNTRKVTMDKPVTLTAEGVEGKTSEEYLLTLDKDANVSAVTVEPASSTGWYAKGTSVKVQSATYGTGYKHKAGVGSTFKMDKAQTASVTSQPVQYTIAYNYNLPSGATNKGGTQAAQKKTYATALTLTAVGYNVPTITGYTYAFKEWNTKADGKGTAYTNKQKVTTDPSSKDGATVNLYAIWTKTPITYTIKFDKNGGTGSMSNLSMTYDTAKNLTASGFTKSGYAFIGWSTSKTGARAYGNKESVKNLSSTSGEAITLYAVWGHVKPVTAGSGVSYKYQLEGESSWSTDTTGTANPSKAITAMRIKANKTSGKIVWQGSGINITPISCGCAYTWISFSITEITSSELKIDIRRSGDTVTITVTGGKVSNAQQYHGRDY